MQQTRYRTDKTDNITDIEKLESLNRSLRELSWLLLSFLSEKRAEESFPGKHSNN